MALVRGRPENYRFYNLSCSARFFYQYWMLAFALGLALWFSGPPFLTCIRNLSSQMSGDFLQVAGYVLAHSLLVIIGAGLPVAVGLLALHIHSDIGVGPDGLAIQVYVFFWKLIPWDSVLAVETPWLPGKSGSYRAVIVVRHLTLWHRIIVIGVAKLRPGVLITTDHENWRELLQEVSNRVDERAGWKAERQE